ncbi:MAG: hypothetical protein Q4P06_04470, partial [Actinomycetaceae bacterium]|nr:hypothetical protein [Actinomycetaceae bacterium]
MTIIFNMKSLIRPRKTFVTLTAAAAAAAFLMAGCAVDGDVEVTKAHDHEHGGELAEAMSLEPRVVMTYDGGLMVVDTAKQEVTTDITREGFLRLNPAGDGRHLFVSEASGFTMFDGGLQEVPHGNHSHYFSGDPAFQAVSVEAEKPGHVVTHAGQTALFADGTGEVTIFDSGSIHDGDAPASPRTFKTENPHHGVAVPLADGKVLVTEGTKDERKTIRLLDADNKELARTDQCPGVHGEAAAGEGDTIAFGCQDGQAVYKDGKFHKVQAETEYQRSGTLRGSAASDVILTDYKVDKDAKMERPTKVGLLNTKDLSFKTVDLGSPYWFRSLDRGANGEGVVLTNDGKLHIIDMDKGEVLRAVEVVKPWEEKEQWQQPNASVRVSGAIAYVTDVQEKKLHMVDIEEGKIMASVDLPHEPNEIAVVTGMIPHGVKVAELEGHDHEHEGHDHGH